MQSVGLMAVHQTKLDRYALLAALTERQALDGLRTAAPTILPVAVSTHGEFCPGAVRLQEWLTSKYRARLLLEGDRDDGEKTEDLTAAFRREFRSSLLVASCKGMADMLLAAGMPFAGKRVHGWRSAGGGSAHAPPAPTPPPSLSQPPHSHSPHLGRRRGSKRAERREDEDNEDEYSTASSSADDAGEDATFRGPPRRSARLVEQALTRAAARTPTSTCSDACGADSAEDCGEDSGASWSVGDDAWLGRADSGAGSGSYSNAGKSARSSERRDAQLGSLRRLEHALTHSRRDHLCWLDGADSDADSSAGCDPGCGADRISGDGARGGRALPDSRSSSSGGSRCNSSSSSCSSSGGSSSSSSSSSSGSSSSGYSALMSLVVCGDFPIIT
jgi:hypothetical protein